MTEPIKLPPLPRLQVPRIDADIDLMDIRRLAQWAERIANEHAIAAIEADRQSRDCGQCVPLSTDGKSVFIDGVGEMNLDFGGQARGEPVACFKCGHAKHDGECVNVAPQNQQQASGWPKVNGVGRVLGSEQSLEVYFDSEPSDDQLRAVHNFLTSPQPQQIPEGFQPLETIKYWAEAYSNPEGDEHFMGHGMAAQLLKEYAQLRAMLEAAPEPKEQ